MQMKMIYMTEILHETPILEHCFYTVFTTDVVCNIDMQILPHTECFEE